MPQLHPRFHSVVSKHADGYFEPQRILSKFTSETLHTYAYRGDLQKRIETLLLTPMDVFDKLLPLGSSEAIGKRRVRDIANETVEKEGKKERKLIEIMLLFRVHHSPE